MNVNRRMRYDVAPDIAEMGVSVGIATFGGCVYVAVIVSLGSQPDLNALALTVVVPTPIAIGPE